MASVGLRIRAPQFLLLVLLAALLAPLPGHAADGADMARFYDLIYQVRVVARNAGSKSSIGSGFQVSVDGLVVTNFHVVAGAVHAPDSHRIEYLDQDGNSGELQLLDFDVVHDLALLRHPEPPPRFFEVNRSPIAKGAMLYALGNPHDLGITLKTGAFNGMVEHSYNPQILFSGSLNPGMSGGPGLLGDGRVAGVNVATAGSDLSFLVPAEELLRLIDAERTLAPTDYDSEIARQVLEWQQERFADLLARDWPQAEFGNHGALDEIRNDVQCWGQSNEDEEEITVEIISKDCNAGNNLYLGDNFSTGNIHYSFWQERSISLSPLRFHYNLDVGMYPDNYGDDTQLTNFECQSEFLQPVAQEGDAGSESSDLRGSICVRAYIKMPGLFDVLMLAVRTTPEQSYGVHYTLSGVSQQLAEQFAVKFFASLGWQG